MAETNISRFALFLEILKSSEHEIWPSYREKQLKKYVQIRFFKFQFIRPEIPHWWQKIRILANFSQNGPFFTRSGQFLTLNVQIRKT